MRIAIIFLFLVYVQDCISQEDPFITWQYDSVLIYDFGSVGGKELSIIGPNNKFAASIKKTKKLTTEESKKLNGIVGKRSSYGQGVAACFDPHLGIVYFKNGKPNAHITICIDCNRLVSTLKIPAQDQGKETSEEGDIYYTLYGMSKSLRTHLNKLLKKYNFSHQLIHDSMFD